MYLFYRIISYILFSKPIVWCVLRYRKCKNKESLKSIFEKQGLSESERPNGKLIWFHAASVGEMKSIIPLIRYINKHEKYSFLISTCTQTSAKLFKKLKLENSTHVFAPLDNPVWVKRFLLKWKPQLGIFVDSELWPNLIVQSSKLIPLISVNSRLSDKSFKTWKWFKKFASFLLSKFDRLFPVSQNDLNKISYFIDSSKIQFIGNLKDSATPIFSEEERSGIIKTAGDKKVFLAASTHKGEDQEIIEAFLPFKNRFLLIIVPKHPSRFREIADIMKEYNLIYSIRSRGFTVPLQDSHAYIADTIGELDLFYSLANIAFVGGSIVKHGGQNFVEAARHNALILFGPNTSNFKDATELFLENKAAIVVKGGGEISGILSKFNQKEREYKKYIRNANKLAKNDTDILSAYHKIIKTYMSSKNV